SGHYFSYTYDSDGNMLSETNPNGASVHYEYDRMNRRVKITSPMGYKTYYQYDGMENVTRRTDPENRQTNYSYDPLNRLILTAYPAGSIERVYDSNGNMQKISNMGVGLGDITERTYDVMDRLATEKIWYGLFTKTVSYAYDPVGNIIKVTDPDGKEISYAYDDLNQPKKITGSFSDVAGLSYDAAGLYSRVDFPNGERNQSAYDKLNRLLSKETRDTSNSVIFRYDYKYNPVGQIAEVSRNGIPEANFNFDADGRLVNANYPFSGKNILYGYDDAGNRLTEVDKGAVTSYVYNTENRVVRQVLPDLSSINYQYDKNGNVVQTISNWGTVNYGYDYENRLISVNYPPGSGIVMTLYSPEGNRLAKVELIRKTYYYPTLVGTIIEMDENGKTLKRLNPGISQADVTGDNPDIIYQHWDGRLSTSFFTGHSIVASVTFDYFGEVLESSGNLDEIDPALYWTGLKVDGGTAYNAELIGTGYAPDINQYFGNTSFEPWNIPGDIFLWLEDLKGPETPTDGKPVNGSAPVTPGAKKKKEVEACGYRENVWETTGSKWVYIGCYADNNYLPQKRLVFKYEKKKQQKEVTITCWREKGHPGHHVDSERTETGRTRLESYKPPFYEYKKSGQLQDWPDQETRDKEGARLLGEKNKK
ncbi:MAG: hypothetical protein NTV01_05485, partial [Bacteroidia bacterium]|nr:hypothetical protein [Bacteroidia bacterium]